MSYKIRKSIKQYSITDLLEILENSRDRDYYVAKSELERRNISDTEIQKAKEQLQIRAKYKRIESQKPLGLFEKLVAFFVPISILPIDSKSFIMEQIDEDIENKFQLYGSEKKRLEYSRWKIYGIIFYLIIVVFYFSMILK